MVSSLSVCTLDDLAIDDEAAFRHVPLYAELKSVVRRGRLPFRALAKGGRWERALLLNLTCWGDGGGDVLMSRRTTADVVTHVAWHDLATSALVRAGARPSADALLFGEALASGFDLYLVGTLLRLRARSVFLDSHVAAMADAASDAGVGARAFAKLLAGIAADPARSFEELRELLFDVSSGLLVCNTADEANALLDSLDTKERRFAPLLHQYAVSAWVLYARAFGSRARARTRAVRKIDAAVRASPSASLAWLASHWLAPRLRALGDDVKP